MSFQCHRLRKEAARAQHKELEISNQTRQALLENDALSRTVERLQKDFAAEKARHTNTRSGMFCAHIRDQYSKTRGGEASNSCRQRLTMISCFLAQERHSIFVRPCCLRGSYGARMDAARSLPQHDKETRPHEGGVFIGSGVLSSSPSRLTFLSSLSPNVQGSDRNRKEAPRRRERGVDGTTPKGRNVVIGQASPRIVHKCY